MSDSETLPRIETTTFEGRAVAHFIILSAATAERVLHLDHQLPVYVYVTDSGEITAISVYV